ncbi:antibiotic biosynthesis monooxygenase [Herbaspirillum sp. RV1423]|uniref:antibiotic biosynthesis monooxygenase n=1 Tax=Herbaspirillum sp. RV1423 TaxID=1443993 RepID=UPI0004B155C0|nr:antibiotic biosynthesis monooxygenase [Herbaspirillum sp. RV1423]
MSSASPFASPSAHPSIFRINRFAVPAASLDIFSRQLAYVHGIFSDLPGLLQQYILTQAGGAAEFNVVTFLEWENADAMAAAHEVVQKTFAADGFDPKKMVDELGIRTDQGFYRKV